MDIFQKILISICILVILTFLIDKIFSESQKEGLTPSVVMAGAMMKDAALAVPFQVGQFVSQAASSMANQAISMSTAAANLGTTLGGQAAVLGAGTGQRQVNAVVDEVSKSSKAVVAQANRTSNSIYSKIDRNVKFISQKMQAAMIHIKEKIYLKMRQIKTQIKNWKPSMKILKYVFMIGLFGWKYLVKVVTWIFNFAKCSLTWFANFRGCFFWYMLEIIGQILYLPFRFLFWIMGCTGDKIEKGIWKVVDGIDCFFFDLTTYHVFRYSPEIIEKCYSCNPGPFPFPDFGDKKLNLSSILLSAISPF